MEGPTIQFVGTPCGQHGPYTFYKAFKYTDNDKSRILSLGEFFFVRITPDSGISVCELQLLWEDKNNDSQYLASLTLYFLPENTYEKRQGYHGDDELIRENDKVVMRLSDLLTWVAECQDWNYGTLLPCLSEDKGLSDQDSLAKLFAANNCGLELTQVKKDKDMIPEVKKENTKEISTEEDGPQVKVLSYPQYCRFMATLKRLEKVEDSWLKSALVCALGGLSIRGPGKVYVTFCRDTICHHDLADHEFRQDHLAPNLKGRPRKKKSKSKSGNGDSDSNESDVSFEISNSSSSRSREPSSRRHARQIAQQQDCKEEAQFLENLYSFMRKRNTPIDRVPSLGFKQLDLYAFYMCAAKYGGYETVTQKRLWKHIYDKLGGNPGSTSAATCTRRHYERLLLAYERHLNHEKRANKVKMDKPRKGQNCLLNSKEMTFKHERNHMNNHHQVLSQGKFKSEEMKWEQVRKHSLMEERPKLGLHLAVRKPIKQEGDECEEMRWEKIRKNSLMEDKPKLGLSHGVRNTVRRELEMRQKVRSVKPEDGLHESALNYTKPDESSHPNRLSNYGPVNGQPMAVNLNRAHTPVNQDKSSRNVVQLTSLHPNVRAVPLFTGQTTSLPPSVPSSSPRSLDLKINGRPSVIQRVGHSSNGMVGHPVIPPAAAHTFQPRKTSYAGPSGVIGMPPAAHSGKSYTLPPDTYPGAIKRPRLNPGVPSLPCNPFPPVKSQLVSRQNDPDQPVDFSVKKPSATAPLPSESQSSANDTPLNLVIHKRPSDEKSSPVTKEVPQARHQHAPTGMRLNVSHSISSLVQQSPRGVARAPIFHPPTDPKVAMPTALHSPMAMLPTPPRVAAPHSIATSPIRASPAAAGPFKASPPVPAAIANDIQMPNPAQDGNLILPQYVHLLHPAFPQHPLMLGGSQPMLMTNPNQALVYEARLQSTKLEPPVSNCMIGPSSTLSYTPQLFLPAQQPHT